MSAASRETVSGALTPGHSTTHHVAMMYLTGYGRDVPGDVTGTATAFGHDVACLALADVVDASLRSPR